MEIYLSDLKPIFPKYKIVNSNDNSKFLYANTKAELECMINMSKELGYEEVDIVEYNYKQELRDEYKNKKFNNREEFINDLENKKINGKFKGENNLHEKVNEIKSSLKNENAKDTIDRIFNL